MLLVNTKINSANYYSNYPGSKFSVNQISENYKITAKILYLPPLYVIKILKHEENDTNHSLVFELIKLGRENIYE